MTLADALSSDPSPDAPTEVDASQPVEVPAEAVAPVVPGTFGGADAAALAAADALSAAVDNLIDEVTPLLNHIPKSKRPVEAIYDLLRAQIAYVRTR